MRTFWKAFAALALTLPLGAFVAGNLVSSAADTPEPRRTIVIQEADPTATSADPEDDTPEVDVAQPTPDVVDDHGSDDSSGRGSGSDDSDGDRGEDSGHGSGGPASGSSGSSGSGSGSGSSHDSGHGDGNDDSGHGDDNDDSGHGGGDD